MPPLCAAAALERMMPPSMATHESINAADPSRSMPPLGHHRPIVCAFGSLRVGDSIRAGATSPALALTDTQFECDAPSAHASAAVGTVRFSFDSMPEREVVQVRGLSSHRASAHTPHLSPPHYARLTSPHIAPRATLEPAPQALPMTCVTSPV